MKHFIQTLSINKDITAQHTFSVVQAQNIFMQTYLKLCINNQSTKDLQYPAGKNNIRKNSTYACYFAFMYGHLFAKLCFEITYLGSKISTLSRGIKSNNILSPCQCLRPQNEWERNKAYFRAMPCIEGEIFWQQLCLYLIYVRSY